MRILIIEDDLVIAKTLKNELQKSNYEVALTEYFPDIMPLFSSVHPISS